MTTVAQRIERLKEMNPEAEVRALYGYIQGYGASTAYEDIDLGAYSSNLDDCGDIVYFGWDRG